MTITSKLLDPEQAHRWIWGVLDAAEASASSQTVPERMATAQRIVDAFLPFPLDPNSSPRDAFCGTIAGARGDEREALLAALPRTLDEAARADRYVALDWSLAAASRTSLSAYEAPGVHVFVRRAIRATAATVEVMPALRSAVSFLVRTMSYADTLLLLQNALSSPGWLPALSWVALLACEGPSNKKLEAVLLHHGRLVAEYLQTLTVTGRRAALRAAIQQVSIANICQALVELDPESHPQIYRALLGEGALELDSVRVDDLQGVRANGSDLILQFETWSVFPNLGNASVVEWRGKIRVVLYGGDAKDNIIYLKRAASMISGG